MAPIPEVSDFQSFEQLASPSASEESNCIWYLTHLGRRCNNIVNKADRTKALVLGATIQRNSSHEISLEQLKEYARLKCCNQARHRLLLTDYELQEPLARRWLKELSESEPRPSEVPSTPDSPLGSDTVHEPATQGQPVPRIIQTRLRSQQSSQAELLTQRTDFADSNSSPFRPRIVPQNQSVFSKLRDPLRPRSATGTIYLFTRTSSPGFVKIGYSKWPAQCRLRDWEKTCGYKPILLASFDDVPHMQKVEQLIHFELADAWRVEKRCAKCPRRHQEWFEIDTRDAIKVAEQWVEWMKKAKPYDEDKYLTDDWIYQLRRLEADGIPVTAESLLDAHSKLLALDSDFVEEPEIPETQPEPLDEPSPIIMTDSPLFTDDLTAEPDLYSSSSSQVQSLTISSSNLHLFSHYLLAILTMMKAIAQISPDVLQFLIECCALQRVATSQTSMVSSVSQ